MNRTLVSVGLLGLLCAFCAGPVQGSPKCHWNGYYDAQRCHCYDGFLGDHCEFDCHCEGHGHCYPDGTCQCEEGWRWSGAEQKCVWDCHCDDGVACLGPGECGCGQQCRWGQCRNGVCQCYEGYTGQTCHLYDHTVMQNKDVAVGINVAGITYYSSEIKWVDLAKQSQEWVTQRDSNHTWNTQEHDLVEWRTDGYPARLDSGMKLVKLVLRGFGSHEQSGNYTVLYQGDGHLTFTLTPHHLVHNGKGRMVVNFPQISDGGILLQLTSTNPSNPIRNIRILHPGYENTYQRFPFHPLFLQFLKRFSEIRFMDFLSTNNHEPEPTTWSSRLPLAFHTQAGRRGGSVEYLVQLANTVGANPWVCIPHAADDDYVTNFAAYLKHNLRPELKVYVEYSNEVWNGIFRQTRYTQEQGRKLFPDQPSHRQGLQFYNKRATEVAPRLWTQVWGAESSRLTRVYAWQTGYRDYYRQALADLGDRRDSFDALAITGYFNCDHAAGHKHASDLPGMTMQDIQSLCNSDLENQKSTYSHYMEVAKSHGLKLVMYEGGPSVMENGAIVNGAHVQEVTDKAVAFNRDPAIQKPVADILQAWHQIVTSNGSNTAPGGLFNYFSSTRIPGKYGSWGMTEYTGQNLSTVPKWLAVQSFISDQWPNNPLGPWCSFVLDRSTATAYVCFPSGNQYVCATSADHGRSWANFPSLQQGHNKHVTLDGYDVKTKRLYARVTDRIGVNSYHMFDERSYQWTTLQNFQYISEELTPSVVSRFPVGGDNGLAANLHC